jgi:hypothetical protein
MHCQNYRVYQNNGLKKSAEGKLLAKVLKFRLTISVERMIID